jgi:hypothetical protein
LTEVGGELLWSNGEIQADSDHGPAILGLGLYEDAGELAALEPDVVGPLDLARDVGAECLGGGADRERDRERQQQVALVERAEDRRVEQGLAFRGGPDSADASPAGGLFAGGDDGASGGSGFDQLASACVGRIGDAIVAVWRAELHSGALYTAIDRKRRTGTVIHWRRRRGGRQ